MPYSERLLPQPVERAHQSLVCGNIPDFEIGKNHRDKGHDNTDTDFIEYKNLFWRDSGKQKSQITVKTEHHNRVENRNAHLQNTVLVQKNSQ